MTVSDANIMRAKILDFIRDYGKPVTPKKVAESINVGTDEEPHRPAWNTVEGYMQELAAEGLLHYEKVGIQNVFFLPTARSTKLTQQELESHLWKAADILRGSIDSSDYKNYIFGMLFLKRLNDVFEEEAE